jgi:hypothetical protein
MAEVACPKCGRLHEEYMACASSTAAVDAASDSAVAQTQSSSPVVNRYRDAYRVGAALVGFGNAIKTAGAILGGIIVVVSLSEGSGLFAAGGVFFGVAVGLLLWVCGVMVAAQGQILRATLDNAVASSHFLTNPERADAMGLPQSIAHRGAPQGPG